MATDISDLTLRLREETPLWGHLPARMRFKQALVERFGVEAAFGLAVPELGVPGLQTLRRRCVRPLREVARSEGSAYHELWPGGTRHRLPLPRVIGVGDHRPTSVTDRAAYLACVDDVLVRGRSDILLRADAALIDFEGDEYDPARDNPEYDPAILAARAAQVWVMEPLDEVARLPEALMLCGGHAVDFGHWLVEFLPKLAAARIAGWRGGMPVLVDQHIPETVRAALPGLLPADAPLVTVAHLAPMRVDRLWCMANATYPGFYPSTSADLGDADRLMAAPQRFATLLREVGALAAEATARPTGIERVYLARRAQRKKTLVNDGEIGSLLERHGFHCVYPEDLSLVEQWRLLRHARFIVAPEGSNSLLALFARPGAKACILGPPNTHRLTDVCALLAALDVEPTLLTGPSAADRPDYSDQAFWSFWNDYRIDAATFEYFLRDWLPPP